MTAGGQTQTSTGTNSGTDEKIKKNPRKTLEHHITKSTGIETRSPRFAALVTVVTSQIANFWSKYNVHSVIVQINSNNGIITAKSKLFNAALLRGSTAYLQTGAVQIPISELNMSVLYYGM